jgi:Fe(II)/alpha-ketoglutarate-dependent arginine beta-hydroxylase
MAEATELRLDRREAHEVARLAVELANAHETVEDPDLVEALPMQVRRLPSRLTTFLLPLRRDLGPAAYIVRGVPVDDAAIGPSPLERRTAPETGPAKPQAIILLLLSAVLGDVIGWRTLQGGRLVQDLSPIPSEAGEKTGYSSNSTLDPHTEDHFHPARCDYLGLMCMRNPDRVPTNWCGLEDLVLSTDARRVLSQPRFFFIPDPEHERHLDPDVERPWDEPAPVLFGGRDTPYVRLDAPFTRVVDGDHEAAEALAALDEEANARLRPAHLEPGDVLFLDNFRAVHGRSPFSARHDGTDRWLKRVNITRDLRRSRAFRPTANSRIIQ